MKPFAFLLISLSQKSPLPGIWIKVEQFNSARLVIDVEDGRGSTSVKVALDDDGKEGAKHADGLEGVRPHDCLDPPDRRVEDADDKDDDDGNVEGEAGDLLEGEGRGIDDDCHVHRHLDCEAAGGQQPHRFAKPFKSSYMKSFPKLL